MGSTLDSFQVVDLTCSMAGAYAGRLMADFGAAVTRVDLNDPGGAAHRSGCPAANEYAGPFAGYLNLGKHDVAIDLDGVNGRTEFASLLASADVVLRSGSSCSVALGDYPLQTLRELAPNAVVTTVSATDPDDEMHAEGADELLVSARSGWAAVNRASGYPPLKPSGFQNGFQAGLVAFTATVAELYAREVGAPDEPPGAADISMLEVLASTMSPALLQFQYQGAERTRARTGFPHGPVAAKDGYFILTTSRAHFWRDGMNALGLPDLAEDRRFLNPAERTTLYDEVQHVVEDRIRQREKLELFNTLGTLRVSAGAVQDVHDLTLDPHLEEREFWEVAAIDGGKAIKLPGAPFRSAEAGWAIRGAGASEPAGDNR